jgi:glucokinase
MCYGRGVGYQKGSGFAIGLDLGGTDLKSGIVAPDGALSAFSKRPSRTLESAEAPLEVIVAAVEELRSKSPEPPVAVGLGSPGAIDPASGTLIGRTAHLPHWDSLPLRALLERRLSLPVRVDNDANLAALAESRAGAARGARVSLTLTLGTGVGCGVVVEGRVFRGASGGAGEIGHLPIGDGADPCACGVAHCVEPEASASGLVRRARASGLEAPDAGAVFAAAERGEAVAAALVERMTDRLGACIAIAVDLFQPDIVVIGGGGARAGESLLRRVRVAVLRHALPSHTRSLKIELASLGEQAGTIGAGLLGWEAAAG